MSSALQKKKRQKSGAMTFLFHVFVDHADFISTQKSFAKIPPNTRKEEFIIQYTGKND